MAETIRIHLVVPPEMKTAYDALCAARGMTISDALREHMLAEIGRSNFEALRKYTRPAVPRRRNGASHETHDHE